MHAQSYDISLVMSLVVIVVVVDIVVVVVAKENSDCNNRQDRANFLACGRIGQL